MSLRRSLFCRMLAVCVAFAPAHAIAAPPGSKNFTSPPYVPNYFSSEAGSFQGNATARAPQPGAGPAFAAPAPRHTVAAASRRFGRHHAARVAQARGYVRLARGTARAHRQFVAARVARARVVHAEAARAGAVHAAVVQAGAARARVADARAARSAKAAGRRTTPAAPPPAGSKAVAAKIRPAPIKGKPVARARG